MQKTSENGVDRTSDTCNNGEDSPYIWGCLTKVHFGAPIVLMHGVLQTAERVRTFSRTSNGQARKDYVRMTITQDGQWQATPIVAFQMEKLSLFDDFSLGDVPTVYVGVFSPKFRSISLVGIVHPDRVGEVTRIEHVLRAATSESNPEQVQQDDKHEQHEHGLSHNDGIPY